MKAVKLTDRPPVRCKGFGATSPSPMSLCAVAEPPCLRAASGWQPSPRAAPRGFKKVYQTYFPVGLRAVISRGRTVLEPHRNVALTRPACAVGLRRGTFAKAVAGSISDRTNLAGLPSRRLEERRLVGRSDQTATSSVRNDALYKTSYCPRSQEDDAGETTVRRGVKQNFLSMLPLARPYLRNRLLLASK